VLGDTALPMPAPFDALTLTRSVVPMSAVVS
jgi:hypothetical protein